MPRLRITASLSLLALVGVIVATVRLSDRVGGREEPRRRTVPASASAPSSSASSAATLAAVHKGKHAHAAAHSRIAVYVPGDAATRWVPVSMSVAGLPFDRMRDITGGGLVLHLTVNARGEVSAVRLVQSSGDAVIDAVTLQLARHWRFVVPAHRPHGFSGDLPLQFTDV